MVLQIISFQLLRSVPADAMSGGLAAVVVVDGGSANATKPDPSKPTAPAKRTIELRIKIPFPI
jgi:hypothetical protein